MRKVFFILLSFLISTSVFAEEKVHNAILNNDKVAYSQSNSSWSLDNFDNEKIILVKELNEGTGSCSIYNYEDGTLAFALATDYELINNGKFIIIDNNLLKYYKLIYNGENFEQVLLTDEEIKEIFPEAEIFKISWIDSDNRTWLHKPFSKQRTLILVNDTDRCFHKLNTSSKNVQDNEIAGLISINRYGRIKFSHFGERDGKLIFYIR